MEGMGKKSFFIGSCHICCGMLEVVVNINDYKCSIMCDECSAEWENPENALNKFKGFRTLTSEVEVRTATLDEIQKAKWEKYIILQ
jgi:hypothetical protein